MRSGQAGSHLGPIFEMVQRTRRPSLLHQFCISSFIPVAKLEGTTEGYPGLLIKNIANLLRQKNRIFVMNVFYIINEHKNGIRSTRDEL